jgi:hypothetical protein
MAATTAPTITIDGVTSNPASPVSMLALACDCRPIVETHELAVGEAVECEDHGVTTIVGKLDTWMF